jgi:hypothetical protein
VLYRCHVLDPPLVLYRSVRGLILHLCFTDRSRAWSSTCALPICQGPDPPLVLYRSVRGLIIHLCFTDRSRVWSSLVLNRMRLLLDLCVAGISEGWCHCDVRDKLSLGIGPIAIWDFDTSFLRFMAIFSNVSTLRGIQCFSEVPGE